MILSFFKHHLKNSDSSFFEELYETGEAKRKDFTFSLYMEECEFLRETIRIPNKRLFLNFSTYDLLTGIQFYNAMIHGRKKEYEYKGITMCIERIMLRKEEIFREDSAIFQTLSPCVVREHCKQENKDWFYSLDTEKGRKLFLENMKYQLLETLPEAKYDIDAMEVSMIRNREVKVKHYGIEVVSNICIFEMKAKAYILEYFYKAGIGSQKSGGFGMLTKK